MRLQSLNSRLIPSKNASALKVAGLSGRTSLIYSDRYQKLTKPAFAGFADKGNNLCLRLLAQVERDGVAAEIRSFCAVRRANALQVDADAGIKVVSLASKRVDARTALDAQI